MCLFRRYKSFSDILREISYSLRKFSDSKEKGILSEEESLNLKEKIEIDVKKSLVFI